MRLIPTNFKTGEKPRKNRLKELRQQRNLTLKELGKKVNMLDSTLSQYENERRKPNEEIWQKLATFFGVSVSYLKGETLDKQEIEKLLLPNVHLAYFQEYVIFLNKYGHKINESKFYYNWARDIQIPEFMENINIYIKLTSDDRLPYELYGRDEECFKLTEEILNYWKKNLSKLIDELEEENIRSNVSITEILDKFNRILVRERNKLVHNVKPTTSNLMYEKIFNDEKSLHDKMIFSLRYEDAKKAKGIVNKYYQLIKSLKDQIDSY